MLAASETTTVYKEEMHFVYLCNTGQRIMHVKCNIGTPVKIQVFVFEEVDRRSTTLQ